MYYPIIYRYKQNKKFKSNHKLYVILEEKNKYNSYNQINLLEKIKELYNNIIIFFSSNLHKHSSSSSL
jgi:hypothetical protein